MSRIRIKKLLYAVAGAACCLFPSETISPSDVVPPPGRADKLESFFESYHCPQPFYTADYLRAADTYHLDYRLLPAISIIESKCGQYRKWNNRWGWTAVHGFSTVRAGINFVASRLAQSYFYKDKTTEGKLLVYNPSPRYSQVVKQLMGEIEDLENTDD
jgi:hypothetical protein